MAGFRSALARATVAGAVAQVGRDLTAMGERAATLAAALADAANPITDQAAYHGVHDLTRQMAALSVVDGLTERADLVEGLDVLARHVPADLATAVDEAAAVLAARAAVVLDLPAWSPADLWGSATDELQPLVDADGETVPLPEASGAVRVLIPHVEPAPWVEAPWARMRAGDGFAVAGDAADASPANIDNVDQLIDCGFGAAGDPRGFRLRMIRGQNDEIMIAQRAALPSPARLQIATITAV